MHTASRSISVSSSNIQHVHVTSSTLQSSQPSASPSRVLQIKGQAGARGQAGFKGQARLYDVISESSLGDSSYSERFGCCCWAIFVQHLLRRYHHLFESGKVVKREEIIIGEKEFARPRRNVKSISAVAAPSPPYF